MFVHIFLFRYPDMRARGEPDGVGNRITVRQSAGGGRGPGGRITAKPRGRPAWPRRVSQAPRRWERVRRPGRHHSADRRRVARGLPPERQPGEGRGDGDQNDDMDGAEGQR